MSESMKVKAALGVCLGVGVLLSGCGQVVGADCANEGDYCGSICCPSEYSCVNDMCFLPDGGGLAGDGGACGLLSLLCGSDCINPLENDDHCGGCGSACGGGFDCQSGVCISECGLDERYCDGDCRQLISDENHCGTCGNACASGSLCGLGVCMPEPCDIGTADCGGTCRRLDSDPANCGGCGVVCGTDQVCNGGDCADLCVAPRLVCDGRCVEPSTNGMNCGSCGNVCESGICRRGACRDASFGHLVLIGHDYSTWVAGMNRVVGTAALITLDHDIALLAFEGDSEAASISGAHAALEEVADATGRDIDYNGESIVERVPDRLLGADVFLIHSQQGATNEELLALGFTWRNALRSFLRRGGVVIVLDAGGANSGTHQLLEAAGLISIDARRALTAGTRLRVLDGADAVSRGVPVSYLAPTRSAGFEMRSTVGWVVATDDAAGLPVVIHTVIAP